MKIVGNDGKVYSSVEEAKEADDKFDKAKAEAEAQENAKKAEARKAKKDLVDAIKAAQDISTTKRAAYQDALKRAAEIRKDADNQAKQIVKEALDEISKADEHERECIREFNTKFGPYVKYLSGKDVEDEFNKVVKDMCDLLGIFF